MLHGLRIELHIFGILSKQYRFHFFIFFLRFSWRQIISKKIDELPMFHKATLNNGLGDDLTGFQSDNIFSNGDYEFLHREIERIKNSLLQFDNKVRIAVH